MKIKWEENTQKSSGKRNVSRETTQENRNRAKEIRPPQLTIIIRYFYNNQKN